MTMSKLFLVLCRLTVSEVTCIHFTRYIIAWWLTDITCVNGMCTLTIHYTAGAITTYSVHNAQPQHRNCRSERVKIAHIKGYRFEGGIHVERIRLELDLMQQCT